MSDFYSNNELTHHGVKGMRWGHRKASIASTQPHKRIPGMVVKDESQPKPHKRIPGMVVKDESQPKPRINVPKTNIKEADPKTIARAQKRARVGKAATTALLSTVGIAGASLAAYNYKGNDSVRNFVVGTTGLVGLFAGVPIAALIGTSKVITEAISRD